MASFKKKVNVSRIVLIASIPVILVALVLAGFFSFRRTLARFSMDFYYPFYQAAKKVELTAAGQALAMRPRQELAIAVEQLQRQNADLAAQVKCLGDLEAENEYYRQALNMPRWVGFREVYAEVILRDPASWNEQFVISKGKKDGIAAGDLVLTFRFASRGGTPECVVAGRIIEASEHTAVVATVVNPECRLSVYLDDSNANGTLVGNGTSTMTARVLHLPLKDGEDRAGYSSDEKVVTGGFSEQLPPGKLVSFSEQTPPGILVGFLTVSPSGIKRAAVVHESGLYAEAWMKPAAQLDMIRFVVVLLPTGPESADRGTDAR